MSEVNWYVVQTYSGYENKVKANIEKTIENRHLEDQILEVRVPMEEVVEVKNGTKKQVPEISVSAMSDQHDRERRYRWHVLQYQRCYGLRRTGIQAATAYG